MEGKERLAPNGYFTDGNKIYIDINAGDKGEGAMLYTLSHEIGHYIARWNAQDFKAISDFLFEHYGKDVPIDKLLEYQKNKLKKSYKEDGKPIPSDSVLETEAQEELVCDMLSRMLADKNAYDKLMELKQKDLKLFQKLGQAIKKILDKLGKLIGVYDTQTPDFMYAASVENFGEEAFRQLQDLYMRAFVQADANYQSSLTPGEEGIVVNQNGDPVAHSTEDGTVQLSMRTYEEDGREAFRKYLEKCVSSKKLTKAEMQEMLDGIEDIYQVCKEFKDKYAPFSSWSDAAVVRDTYGKPVFSVVTPNGDYKMNLDFSLVCKKRRTLDAVFNEMSKRGIIDDFELGQKSVVKINEIIRKHGFETACALCFVDAKRFRQASMADSFTRLYNELVESLVPESQRGSIDHFNFGGYETIKKVEDGIHTWDVSKLDFSHLDEVMKNYGQGTVEHKAAKYIKTHAEGRKLLLRGDFMSSQGFDAVKTQNKDILKLYNSKKGTGGPKAAFGDVQYMNEIIKKARTWTPAKAYSVGGVRIQSFSDYVPRMVFDYVQMVYDLATTKLPAHAYTKEALFVKQFGLTGIKINMSLIPAIAEGGIAPGLDANGNYVWAGESFDYETAKDIQNAEGYTENCGTICVGVSYDHILKLLRDPNIRMVIPYHKSGLNPIVAHMNKIAEFHDYTNDQRTKGKDGKALEKDFDFSKALHDMGENASPKAVADQYLKWCVANGYTPRFAEFALEDNYYKLLEDFTLYDKDGNYVPQREVRAVFPTESSAFGSMKSLIEAGLQEDAVIEGKRDASLSSIVDEIEQSLPKTEAEIAETQVAQADHDLEAEEATYSDVMHSERVTDKETLNFLNNQETITTYKTMQIVDGKLYPPMAARTEGQYEDYSVLGAWEQATEHPELIKNGNKFKLDKGKGQGSIEAAYNPYMHSSNLVLNDQFSGAYTRDNLVTVECEVPVSELTSGYHAQYAKDSVGWHAWHTGTVAGSLRKARGIERQVFLSRWIKPVRIVPDAEVASMYKDLLDGTDIAVPDNVVTPSLLRELKNAGVKIKESGRVKYSGRESGLESRNGTRYSNKYDARFFTDNVFPPYNVSHSDSHEVAERWARSEEGRTEKQRLLSHHGEWYVIQVVDDGVYGYKIISKLTAPEYNRRAKNYGKNGRYKSSRSAFDKSASHIRGRTSVRRTGSSVDSAQSGYRGENPGLSGVDEQQVRRGEIPAGQAPTDRSGSEDRGRRYEPSVKTLRLDELSAKAKVLREKLKSDRVSRAKKTEYRRELREIRKEMDELMPGYYPSRSGNAKLSDRDSDGNSLTAKQSAFFAQSKARDKNGNLLMLYHGTARAGFTVFDPSKGKMGGNWFTTSRMDADSYAGNYKHKLFDPNETDEVRSSVGGNFTLGSWMRFDTEADRADFLKQYPNAETIKTDAEYDELLKKADEVRDWDEYDRLEDEQYKNRKELQKLQRAYDRYEWEHSRDATIGELFETPERFSVSDVLRAWDALDSNNAARDEEYTKEDLIDGLREEHNRLIEDGEDGLTDFPFKARLPVGESGDIVNRSNNRTYAVYVNAINPYEIDAKQRTLHGANLYPAIERGLKDANYDSVIVRNARVGAHEEVGDVVIIKDSTQVKLASNKAPTEGTDIRYQDRTDDSVSNRSLLANAFEGIVHDETEKQKIQEYKGKVAMLDAEEKKLHELNAQIKELSFAKGKRDTKKINDLRFDANQTANRIATLDKMLLGLEASTPLQNILQREKKMAYNRAEQKGKESLAEYKAKVEAQQKETTEKWRESRKTAVAKARETAEKRDAREKLQKLVLDTVKWITYPAKTDVKCPDILKQPYADFLNGIDLSSKRLANGGDATKNDLRMANAMSSLATALDKIMTSQDPNQETDKVLDTGYLDLPANFVQKLRDMTENIKDMMVDGDYVVNNMSAAEVRQLSQMIRTLNHAIKTMSNLYANLRFANVEALGFDTMEFMDALGEIEKTGGVKDFVQWDNVLPFYAFKRFGKGGESVFEGLMDAQDKLAFLAQKIFDFREKAWTDKEAKAWSEDTHTIDLPNGNKLTLTTADAMSIYCLSRREQGLQHLLGGGTRVMGIQKGSQKAKDSRSVLTIKDIEAINSSLTDRQKAVAEAIQEFMSTVCSEWGNEISMKRFLTKEFTEKFYFPIESNDENLPTKDPSAQQSDLFRLLNISATKPLTPGANNEVIIRNIFDVFTAHASDMARLNAYGLALLDYMKWLNYREKTTNDEGQVKVRGVRKSMELAYGNAAKGYVLNLVKDVNGRASDGGDPTILMKWMRNAKTASVGSSLRVATLQITSYPRAALVLSPKSLTLGLTKLPNINKAKKYCGIALWKSFGFYDTNISRSIEDQMKGVKDVKQKLIELSLKGAEWGDAITWGALWNACEYEVASTRKYKVGTEEFYQEVGKKLREVVYRTQVVDSTLTRSQMMRSKRGMAQEAAAFMSEPTLSANILMDAGFQFNAEKRRTGSAKEAWKKTGSYIGRAVAVYSIGQLAAALLEGLWDAWRDDEDEEFGEKFLNAFVENLVLDLVPFNKLPIVSDVFEAALAMFGVGFYSSDKMSTTWLTQAVSAVDAWKDALSDESSVTIYNALYKSVRAISSYYGASFSGVMREGVALWNNTAGAYDATLKVLTYDRSKAELGNLLLDAMIEGDDRQAGSLRGEFADTEAYQSALRTAIKNRFEAGEIDYDTALQYLVEYGGMDEDKAFWKVEEWEYEEETGKDFSKYNEFYQAVQTGKDLKAVIKEYTDNGVSTDTLKTQITEHFKPLYIEMSTAEKANIKGYLLNAMTVLGMDREDAEEKIGEWEFEGKYGFAYDDKAKAYKDGIVSASQLKTVLMSVGGMTSEEADNQIEAYDWEKQGYEDVTMAAVREYNEHCAASRVPKDVYLYIRSFSNKTENDVDANGKTIYYSAMQKVMAEINAQTGLTSDQKTAIARSLGWAEKNIQKYKTW